MKNLKMLLLSGMAICVMSAGAFAEGYQQRTDTQSGDAYSTMEPAAGKEMTSMDVRDLQQRLDTKGFSPGPIDGVMGPRTKNAIREFQQANNLPVTGKPTMETMDHLGLLTQDEVDRMNNTSNPGNMDSASPPMGEPMSSDAEGNGPAGF